MSADLLRNSIAAVAAGRWAVGVSGGADSVALLRLLLDRADLSLHVVHLDHQTRAGESGQDANFVAKLAEKLKVPCTIALREDVESGMTGVLKNTSSRFRKARLELFGRVVKAEHLLGVLLAHHADDQAETVLLRILRGAGPAGLAGMRSKSVVDGLQIFRPLLGVSSEQLREFLRGIGQAWREDSSNQSDKYRRNRVRRFLKTRPQLRDSLLKIGVESEALRLWLDHNSPVLPEAFVIGALADLPLPVARHSAVRWLVSRGAPERDVTARVADRLIEMATDAASIGRQDFPGELHVRRRRGRIEVISI